MNQLRIGNDLLRTTIYLLHVCYKYDVTAIMEHPSRLQSRLYAPYSWLLPQLSIFEGKPNVRFFHIHQCMFGAASIKPTTLLTIHGEA
eukprot:7648121-Pyramimonas_sp.AAC.1